MSTDILYIIGNGFDLAHKLPTSYNDFYLWLQKKRDHSNVDGQMRKTISTLIQVIDQCEQKRTKKCTAKDAQKWSCLEECCGDIQLSSGDINLHDRSWFDEEGEEHDVPYTTEEKGKEVDEFVKTVEMLNILFAQWVDSLKSREDMQKVKTHKIDYFTKALKEQNYRILNFNYTDTLESVYGVDAGNICYIHGRYGTKGKYYFGHGKRPPAKFPTQGIRDYARYYMNSLGTENGNYFPDITISRMLFKDTGEACRQHKTFFENISGVKDIYVYGFSFGSVDMAYIRKINQVLPGALWHIYQYSEKDICEKTKNELRKVDENIRMEYWNGGE